MKKKLFLLLLFSINTIFLFGCMGKQDKIKDNLNAPQSIIDDNYRNFYEIYVGGFVDSNGDGTGDLQGIISKLDYLNDGNVYSKNSLGVNGIWLMPIMESPSYHKYDVKDYYSIDKSYGTMDDFEELIDKCNERNVDVIIDLVLNHTSTMNSWFVTACNALKDKRVDSKYYDFYSFVKEQDKETNKTYYPVSGTEYYYEANFDKGMPELNLNNDYVKEEILNICKFWLEKGVAGFRLDAVRYAFYGDDEKNIKFWKWFNTEVQKLRKGEKEVYLVGENWSSGDVTDYYESLNVFDFDFATGAIGGGGEIFQVAKRTGSINDFSQYLENYQQKVLSTNSKAIMQPFLSNHDMTRVANNFKIDNYEYQLASAIYMLMPGSPFIYYGEEIGMRGKKPDPNIRLGMLWGDIEPAVQKYASGNTEQPNGTVLSQISQEDSLLHHYRRLIAIRNANPEIARGNITAIVTTNFYLGGWISTYKESSVLVLFNTNLDNKYTINLNDLVLNREFKQIRGYVGQGSAKLTNNELTLDANTVVILK